MDQNFITDNLPDRANGELPRQILYEDKDTGFCVCGHVHDNEAIGALMTMDQAGLFMDKPLAKQK